MFIMSCLNLRRLLPSKRVWKLFSSKLQIKLHKQLDKSRPIKKPRTSNKISFPNLTIQPKKFKFIRPNRKLTTSRRHYHYSPQKKSAPVYVDQLFIEPVSLVKEYILQPPADIEDDRVQKKEKCSSSRLTMREETSCSKEEGDLSENPHSADDMWESLVMASPQLHGINERAEEFIAKFRADMLQQEY